MTQIFWNTLKINVLHSIKYHIYAHNYVLQQSVRPEEKSKGRKSI